MADSFGDAITNVVTILGHVTTTITGSPVLMAMFVAGVFGIAAKVFKKIKRAAK